MVAPRLLRVPLYIGDGGQPGGLFGALAQVIQGTENPYLHFFNVLGAKCVGHDIFDLASLKETVIVSGRKKIKNRCRQRGRTNSEKTVGQW